MLSPTLRPVPEKAAQAPKRGPVSISTHEIGHEEVEVRLYEGPVGGNWAAVVCQNWQVLSFASGYSPADVVEHALEKAKAKLSTK
jgi:ribosomal protein L16/L10AE